MSHRSLARDPQVPYVWGTFTGHTCHDTSAMAAKGDAMTPQPDSHNDPGLDEGRRALLLRVLHVAYPHGSFPDGPYERTAAAIEAAAALAPEQAGALVAGLDDLRERGFADADDEAATQLLRQVEDTAFFAIVRSTAVVALYSDHEVWDLLGYEGASFDQGGYLHRGFDDLDWLPDPRITEYDGPARVELVPADTDGARGGTP